MKNTQKILSVIAALTLAVSLPAEIMTTSTAAAVSQKSGDREQLTITDEAGLIKFAKACSIDSYSKNLYVTLGSDIELPASSLRYRFSAEFSTARATLSPG